MSAVADISPAESALDLDAELNDVAGHLNAQYGRLVDLTIQLLADKSAWQGPGVWSAEQFLAWRVGIAPHRARQIVEVARRAHELPCCVEALRRGELSIDQVAPIAKRAPWWTDAQMTGLAKNLTVTQIRRVVSQYRFPTIANPDAEITDDQFDAADDQQRDAALNDDDTLGDPPGDAATPDSSPRDVCRFHTGDDDRFRLFLETDALTGKVIEAALAEARDSLFQAGQADVDWMDAVREMSERSLDAIDAPSRRRRFRINIHLATDGTAVDATGHHLPDAVAHHITCDGQLDPVFVASGRPVSVGRRQHIVPERTRRLILLRDRGCRVPGCTTHRFLEVHHVIHWLHDGVTDTWNLIALCPHHHRLHHSGKLGISGNADEPDGVQFTFANGCPITMSGARPKPPGAPPPPPRGVYEHPVGERLDGRWLYFNPPAINRHRHRN